jgi:hypothetical protein
VRHEVDPRVADCCAAVFLHVSRLPSLREV